jgi:hypothetical protein
MSIYENVFNGLMVAVVITFVASAVAKVITMMSKRGRR